MNKHIYGPIPSRRLGQSLGISPIPKKTCNYACVYCMLGPTKTMVTKPSLFYPVSVILNEFKTFLEQAIDFDVVSIVGDGEPTLYSGLSELIAGLKTLTNKPIAIITNGATLDHPVVYNALLQADIVLPSVNGYDEATFKKINRPHKSIDFHSITEALIRFCNEFKGQVWLELMLVAGVNDSDVDLQQYKTFFKQFRYDRLYINTPIRIPTEPTVHPISHERMLHAMHVLQAIGIEDVYTHGFVSGIEDDYKAILSLIKRHPMHQHEIRSFLENRKCQSVEAIFKQLESDDSIEKVDYHGFRNYRI